jgi:hypothetical protein
MVTSIVDINFKIKVEVEVINIVLVIATHKGSTLAEVTHRIKGSAIDIAETIYDNSLKSTTSITRKVTSLHNTL